jgi:ribonuclease P protein component
MERRLRLRDEADFRRVRAGGRAWANRGLTLLVAPNALSHNRYGFVVSKRVGKAVTRNLVKRRLREILRQLDRAGRIPPGHDLALIVRPALAEASFAEARDAVTELLARARLLRPAAEAEQQGAAEPAAETVEQAR